MTDDARSRLPFLFVDARRYYDGGTSSFYLWDQDEAEAEEGSYAGTLLFKKDCGKVSKSTIEKGVWDAVHVLEAAPKGKGDLDYKLTSTVMLSATKKDLFKLEGSLVRQAQAARPAKQGHVANIGAMVEELEGSMRNDLQQVYFGWCEQVISSIRGALSNKEVKLVM